jgi:hypothetical protein
MILNFKRGHNNLILYIIWQIKNFLSSLEIYKHDEVAVDISQSYSLREPVFDPQAVHGNPLELPPNLPFKNEYIERIGYDRRDSSFSQQKRNCPVRRSSDPFGEVSP